MTGYEFQDHRPMAHHARSELLLHLREHLLWGKMHLDEYCYRYPNPSTHTTPTEIHYHIRQAMHLLDTLPPVAQKESNGDNT